MEKLIQNAMSQFKKFGEVKITIYPNSIYEDGYLVVEKSIDDALDCIKCIYSSICDDIHVPNVNNL